MNGSRYAAMTMAATILGVMLAAGLPGAAHATDASSADEKSIRDTISAYVTHWNAGDVAAMIEAWSPEGTFVEHTGRQLSVKDLIGKDQQEFSDAPQRPQLAIDISTVRLITPDVAVVDGHTTLHDDAGRNLRQSRYTATLSRQEDMWRFARVQQIESRSELPVEPLDALDWLVGEWVGDSGSNSVHVTATRSEGNKFLTRQFEVRQADRLLLTGTQKIGWDPRTRQIKSWSFDSQGSVSEGTWEQRDGLWINTVSGTTRDGRNVTSTNVYTPIDESTLFRQSVHVLLGGQQMPDSEARYVRVGE